MKMLARLFFFAVVCGCLVVACSSNSSLLIFQGEGERIPLNSKDIEDVTLVADMNGGTAALIKLTNTGSASLGEVTEKYINKNIEIIYRQKIILSLPVKERITSRDIFVSFEDHEAAEGFVKDIRRRLGD